MASSVDGDDNNSADNFNGGGYRPGAIEQSATLMSYLSKAGSASLKTALQLLSDAKETSALGRQLEGTGQQASVAKKRKLSENEAEVMGILLLLHWNQANGPSQKKTQRFKFGLGSSIFWVLKKT